MSAGAEPPPRRAWSEVYAPAAVAFLGGAVAIVAEPGARAWIDGLVGPVPGASARSAWLAIGPVLVAALLARGAAGALGHAAPTRREAGAWLACAALTGMLALADRVHLFEAQALMLGVITLVWWCSESAERHAAGAGRSAGSGAGVAVVLIALALAGAIVLSRGAPGAARSWPFVLAIPAAGLVAWAPRSAPWVSLLCLMLSLAVAGFARVVGGAVLAARMAEAAGAGSWVFAVAEALGSSNYLSGLSTLAPDAIACGVAAACAFLVSDSPAGSRRARLAGFTLMLVGVGLCVRWALGVGTGA